MLQALITMNFLSKYSPAAFESHVQTITISDEHCHGNEFKTARYKMQTAKVDPDLLWKVTNY